MWISECLNYFEFYSFKLTLKISRITWKTYLVIEGVDLPCLLKENVKKRKFVHHA